MKYIKIENAGSLNRKKLEIIGLSTKRGKVADSDTIGHKGSGTKLAAVASKRLGLEASIASTDHIGTYLLSLDVDVQSEGDITVHRLMFNYSPSAVEKGKRVNARVASGLTIEAFEDWDRPIGTDASKAFKVLREFICNARDEQKDFKLSFVDKPDVVPPGKTAVYLRFTAEIGEMIGVKAGRYFKFLSSDAPLSVSPAVGGIYPKSDPDSTRLFLLGVLVECRNDFGQKSLFDYSLNDKSLISEERILKNYWAYLNEVAKLFGQMTDAALISQILMAVAQHKAPLELEILSRTWSYTTASKAIWRLVCAKLFGDKLCITSYNETIDRDAEQIYGYVVAGKGSSSLQSFFKHLDYPNAADIAPTTENMNYRQVAFDSFDADSKARFHEAFRLFARHFPERTGLPVAFFLSLDERTERMAGFCGLGDLRYKQIWIKAAGPATLSSVQDLFETLVHESRHCVTEADDYDRRFLNKADSELSLVVLRHSGHTKLGNGDPIPNAGDITKLRPKLVELPPEPTIIVALGDLPKTLSDPELVKFFSELADDLKDEE